MAKVTKRSVAPVYLIGLVFALFAFSGHLYAPVHYVLAVVVSLAAFAVARVIFPDKVFEVPDPEPEPEPKTTGNPDLDALISERDKAVGEMHRLNDSIKDEKISAQIDQLEATTKKITDYVVANPQKLPQIRRFMNYYLPTTLKLLNAYDRMGATGVEGANIDGTMGKIEKMMDTVVLAFDKQLDALFGDEALDISSDITVLENMLAREGLGGTQMNA